MKQKPTFLGIGSARSGSTWLHRALDLHPGIRMTQPKQLEFFEKNMLRFDLAWYLDYFETPDGEEPVSVRGEITPFYSRLSRRYVENIHRLFPDLRIVLTIRNPVDRIWSNAGLDFHRYRNLDLETLSIGTFERFACRKRTRLYTDYERIIDCWGDVFGKEAVHVEVFDSISSEPAAMLKRIFRHLGADPDWEPPSELIHKRVLPEGKMRQEVVIPDELRWFLSMEWLPRMRQLNQRLDGRIDSWVTDMEQASRGGSPGWKLKRQLNRLIFSMPEKIAYAGYERLKQRKLDKKWKQMFLDGRRLLG
jgi:hypothetical protein